MGLLYTENHQNGAITFHYKNKLVNLPLGFIQKCGVKILSHSITIQPVLLGGKGAFRQLMRNVGRTTTKSNNQSMARDLNGRRIRDVENERRLETWMDGHQEREIQKEDERQERLQKLARATKVEHQRKTFLDASFDDESNAMMKMMDTAVDASIELTRPEQAKLRKRPGSLSKGTCVKKRKMTKFGFDGEEFSDSESDADTTEPESVSEPSGPETADPPIEMATDAIAPTSTDSLITDEIIDHIEQIGDFEPPKPEFKNVSLTQEDSLYKETKVEEVKIERSTPVPPKSFDSIKLNQVESLEFLQSLENDHLKAELQRRGLKFGGTGDQRANRLWSVKGLKWKNIPKKLKAI